MMGSCKTVLVVLGHLIAFTQAKVDKTIEIDVGGEAVVDAVAAKIGTIFGQDFNFLKRLAQIESDYGPTSDPGGIWRITRANYESTKRDDNQLESYYKKICRFGIVWQNTDWSDMKKPLYSALATHLYLALQDPHRSSFPQTLDDQIEYRNRFYSQGRPRIISSTKTQIINKVLTHEKKTSLCTNKMDLVVVLDGSGSVGTADFDKSKQFVANLFGSYSLDKVRVGFIIFGTRAQSIFGLDNGQSQSQVKEAVLGTKYPHEMTNTNAGIIKALEMFRSASPRPAVPKIMVIFTDGGSNEGGLQGKGGIPDIRSAHQAGITAYAIGIGSSTQDSELMEIARNDTSRKFSITNFNSLLEFFQKLNSQTCKESQVLEYKNEIEDSLKQDEQRTYKVGMPPGHCLDIETKLKRGRTQMVYGYDPLVSPVVNAGNLTHGQTILTNFKEDHPTRVLENFADYGNMFSCAEVEEEDRDNIYVAAVGLDSANDYTIKVTQSECKTPTVATTSTSTTTPTTPSTTTSTTTTPETTTPSATSTAEALTSLKTIDRAVVHPTSPAVILIQKGEAQDSLVQHSNNANVLGTSLGLVTLLLGALLA